MPTKKDSKSKKSASEDINNDVGNKKEENARTKEQIAQLKKQKKEMEDELDELKGDTIGGKISAFFMFLLLLLLLFGGLIGLIKFNVGNFSSSILAPLISDIPVVKYVLPSNLQTQSSQQQAASQAAAQQATSQAASQQAASQAADQAASEAAALKDYVDTYSKMDSKVAASVFDNMMTNQSDLVVKILKNLTSQKRADIISNMSVNNASQLTVLMQQ